MVAVCEGFFSLNSISTLSLSVILLLNLGPSFTPQGKYSDSGVIASMVQSDESE